MALAIAVAQDLNGPSWRTPLGLDTHWWCGD